MKKRIRKSKKRRWRRKKRRRRRPQGSWLSLTVELVLDDVVEDLQQEEDEVVVLPRGEEEPGRGEGLQEVQQLVGRQHGEALQVRRDWRRSTGRTSDTETLLVFTSRGRGLLTVHDDGEQAVEQRLQPLVPGADDLMEDLNTQPQSGGRTATGNRLRAGPVPG